MESSNQHSLIYGDVALSKSLLVQTMIGFAASWLLGGGVMLAGTFHDLGRPVIGAWQRKAWLVHDPVLERELLWSQESSQDGAIFYALDVETGEVQGELKGHRSWVIDYEFLGDGQTLASASADQTIRMWNLAEMQQIQVLTGHQSEVWSVTSLAATATWEA